MSLLCMGTTCSFAAVLVRFDAQNYTVTEGGTVNITLMTNTTDYEFDFSVSLLETMNGSATGELLMYIPYLFLQVINVILSLLCTILYSSYFI